MMAQRRVTDRAERYRAQKLLPVKGKSCLLCGSTRNLVPDHWDGHPDHTNPGNLEVLCKSCNTSKGAAFAKVGRGRLTNQYNPTKGGGAANVGEWVNAVGAITPHVDRGDRGLTTTMTTRDAVDMIRATPQSKRRDFAAKLRRKNPSFDRWGNEKRPANQDAYGNEKRQNPLWGPGSPRWFGTPYVAPAGGVGSCYASPRGKAVRGRPEAARDRRDADERNRQFLQDKREERAASRRVIPKPSKAVKAAIRAGEFEGSASGTWPSTAIFQEGFKRGMTAREILQANPARDVVVRPSDHYKGKWEVISAEGRIETRKSKRGAISWGQRWAKESRTGLVVQENPAAAAAEGFEEFHGYPPSEVVTVSKQVHHHKHLASAGDLVGLQVKPINKGQVRTIEGLGECFLAFNEAKNQLFIEGGDQRMTPAELKKFGIREEHELQTLGKLVGVGYFTNKKHLGDEGGEAVYSHTFRGINENGKHVIVTIARDPDLIYRVLDEQFEVSGGSYEILREGINK